MTDLVAGGIAAVVAGQVASGQARLVDRHPVDSRIPLGLPRGGAPPQNSVPARAARCREVQVECIRSALVQSAPSLDVGIVEHRRGAPTLVAGSVEGLEVEPERGRSVVLLSLIHISEPTRRTPISYAVF